MGTDRQLQTNRQVASDRQAVVSHSPQTTTRKNMSEEHFDEFEHYNFDQEQDKAMMSGHSGKQRSKKEAEQNTNRHNPGGHERKIINKLMNAEKNNLTRPDSASKKMVAE